MVPSSSSRLLSAPIVALALAAALALAGCSDAAERDPTSDADDTGIDGAGDTGGDVPVGDLCAADNGGCDPLTSCTDNGDGTVTCGDCPAGYTGNGADEGGCVDVNDCLPDNPCAPGVCINQLGAPYTCTCGEGYVPGGSPLGCLDVDECAAVPGPCGPGVCTNTDGAYTCDCPWPWLESGGTCALCPPETALGLELAEGSCTAFPGDDVADLVGLAEANLRAVLRGTADALQFVNQSSLLGSMNDCEPQDFECSEFSVDGLRDLADELADALGRELLNTEYITASSACSVTLTPPASRLCGERVPDTCDPDADDCPTNMVCSPDNERCVARGCESSFDCGSGWACTGNTCTRAFCVVDADCETEGAYCLDGSCADYCPFVDLPLSITLWHAGDDDVYAEVVLGTGESAVNLLDLRLFDDQVSVIADAAAVVEGLRAAFLADRYAEDGWEPPLPAAADMGGRLEVDLARDAGGVWELRVNLRGDGPGRDVTGLAGSWVLDEIFDSYPNEVPLPVVLELGQTCPLALVRADDVRDRLTLGVHMSPSRVVLPFAFLANNPFFGGDDDTGSECDGECPCFDVDGFQSPCPCYDVDGMPVDCETGAAVPCPYDFWGEQEPCLPNVGSLEVALAGPLALLSLELEPEGGDDLLAVEALGLGAGASELRRDYGDGEFTTWAALEVNAGQDHRPLQPGLRMAPNGPGVIVTLAERLDATLGFDLGKIADRIVDAPEFLMDEVMRVELRAAGGAEPDLRVRLVEETVRPVEVLAGLLTLYSAYLEETEDVPRTPPGTITVAAGQCLTVAEDTEGGSHPFELFEVGSCPSVFPIAADATVDELDAEVVLGGSPWLQVRGGVEQRLRTYVRLDAAALPSSFSRVRLQLFHDSGASLQADLDVYAVPSGWSESTLTWAGQPFPATVTDEVPVLTLTAESRDGYGWWSFDITEVVRAWRSAPATNFGLVLATEAHEGTLLFLSRESEDEARRPRVLVYP
jgi:hypothetical protein